MCRLGTSQVATKLLLIFGITKEKYIKSKKVHFIKILLFICTIKKKAVIL